MFAPARKVLFQLRLYKQLSQSWEADLDGASEGVINRWEVVDSVDSESYRVVQIFSPEYDLEDVKAMYTVPPSVHRRAHSPTGRMMVLTRKRSVNCPNVASTVFSDLLATYRFQIKTF